MSQSFRVLKLLQLRKLLRDYQNYHSIKSSSKMKKEQLITELEKRFIIVNDKLFLKLETKAENLSPKKYGDWRDDEEAEWDENDSMNFNPPKKEKKKSKPKSTTIPQPANIPQPKEKKRATTTLISKPTSTNIPQPIEKKRATTTFVPKSALNDLMNNISQKKPEMGDGDRKYQASLNDLEQRVRSGNYGKNSGYRDFKENKVYKKGNSN